MIASMLLLIYKSANDLGYKPQERIAMELRDMITAILIILPEEIPTKVLKLNIKNGGIFFRP